MFSSVADEMEDDGVGSAAVLGAAIVDVGEGG